jgi:hypothetical protein
VEETSFRAKSLEGVSTSTTGFAGPTRKGPIGGTPELITSFGDFERIYGGFADLDLGGKVTNYLAHAVRAYFDNGGARLYVARVYAANGAGEAFSAAADPNKARFVARFPGAVGNGRVVVRLAEAPATGRGMLGAPAGSVLKVKGLAPAPARATGAVPPFSLQDGQHLKVTVKGDGPDAIEDVVFKGKSAELTGSVVLGNQVTLGADNTLEIDLGAGKQVIVLPAAVTNTAVVVGQIDNQLVGGYAQLVANQLVIGSERKGISSSVKALKANPAFGFTLNQEAKNVKDGSNSVGDLFRVTAADIAGLFSSGKITAKAAAGTGALLLESVKPGAGVSLQVDGAVGSSAHGDLGLDTVLHNGTSALAESVYVKTDGAWVDSSAGTLDVSGVAPTGHPGSEARFASVNVLAVDADGQQRAYEDLGLAPGHPRYIGDALGANPGRRIDALENLFAIEIGGNVDPYELLTAFTPTGGGTDVVFTLSGGKDGGVPAAFDYEQPLDDLGRIEGISIVAAPGHSAYGSNFEGIQAALISHAETRRAYRIAVLDTPKDLTVGGAIDVRSKIDSTYAALYYPWVVVANPLARPGDESVPRELLLPPSGFACGIYARTDVERGVFKAPANEIVRGALRFETEVNFAEQEVLNPAGVNCLRSFPGRGLRVWGARTASSDPEWKYVNVRRYFLYLEHSIDRGTQWAVFEPNGERLWANVRETIASFLYNEWRSGALLGGSTKEAFFVRCDRSTMTQNDLDNGRLICLIGVAVLKPAEFVIFRIGQKTADARG